MKLTITAAEAKALLHKPEEIALLGIREHGQYGEGHPLFAVPCPYSRLERLVPALVPRRGTRILLLDDGDGVSAVASRRLSAIGYSAVQVIEGGAPAWRGAGLTLFKGVNVPSKVLGELVEEAWHVPMVPPARLAEWQSEGRAFLLFDGRPRAEYRKMTVPGARCLPNGELLHRLPALVPDEATPIVVTCAGRTRGIMGAAGLLAAGLKNPVFALENGTQGWALAGFELLRGSTPADFPRLGESERCESRQRARRLATDHDIPFLDAAGLRQLVEDEDRNLFLFDVRSDEEYSAGTVAGAVHAPAGQLVQATDQWIGVRRSRVVLVDDTGLRATFAAMWLRLLGYEVFVLPDIADAESLDTRRHPEPTFPALVEVHAGDAVAHAANEGLLLDLRGSMEYRAGHLAGARWSIRPRLNQLAISPGRIVYLVADREIAELAAVDLREGGISDVRLVPSGPAEWVQADLPISSTPDEPSNFEAIDFLFFVHDRHDGNLEAARRYLAWETGLVAQLDPDERAEFDLGSLHARRPGDEQSARPPESKA